MSSDRAQRIQSLLEAAFEPRYILVKDQSHLHAGHAGARDGKGHFDVKVIASAFAGKNRIERHRMVYAALGDMMETDIHALAINAIATDEE